MKLQFVIIFLFVGCFSISSQSNNTFFLGHSLINFHVPNMVDKLSVAGNETFSYSANIGNGANLQWHWNNPTTGQGDQWDLTLPNGGYDKFIITEAVPLDGHLQYSETYRYTDSLYMFAEQYNPGIQYYMYETWHCILSGNGGTSGDGGYPCSWDPNSTTLWRERINIDLPKWESIADSLNLIHPDQMHVIPAGQAMGALYDTIQTGMVPGLNSLFDLFEDEHHLDPRGNYFIACVMYAVIHGESPVGLPNQLTDPADVLYTIYPTPAQAAVMQEVAWNIVCQYYKTGDQCATSGTHAQEEHHNIKIYPVPTDDFLTIDAPLSPNPIPFKILDHNGREIIKGTLELGHANVNISLFSEGIYFLLIDNELIKFIK